MNVSRKHKKHMRACVHYFVYITSICNHDFDAYYCVERDTWCRRRHKEVRKALKKGGIF